jgi:hypothetical protein
MVRRQLLFLGIVCAAAVWATSAGAEILNWGGWPNDRRSTLVW